MRPVSEVVEIEAPALKADEIVAAREVLETTKDDHGTNFMRLVRAHRVIDIATLNGHPHHVEVQAIILGREITTGRVTG